MGKESLFENDILFFFFQPLMEERKVEGDSLGVKRVCSFLLRKKIYLSLLFVLRLNWLEESIIVKTIKG